MKSTHKRLFLAVNLAALVAILFWLRDNISPTEVIGQLRAIPLEGLLGALALNIAVLGVYGARLSLLLAARRLPALAVVIIGFGMNGVLPVRLGEIAKLAYARQLFGIATPRLIAATAAEKLLDLCALLVLGLIASQLVIAPYLDRGVAVVALLVAGLVLAMIVAFLALARWERSGRETHSWVVDAVDTLRAQKDKARIVQLASLTAVIWVITVASVYWMFNSVYPQFTPVNAGVLTLVLALAIAIPSAPAGLGVVEAAIVAYLHQALQADANQTLASALAFHFIVVIPQVLITAAILAILVFRRRATKA
jgi:uncharacterized membrane protein YbhN (UPF0104 family)